MRIQMSVRRFRLLLLALTALTTLGACAPRGPTFGFKRDADETRRLAGEYAPYRQKGYATINGRAYLQTPTGQAMNAVYQSVDLTPVTSLSQQAIDEGIKTGEWSASSLAKEHAVVWQTRTDDQGNFDFNALPGGEYFIICGVPWSEGGKSGTTILVGRTHLAPTEQQDFVLTGVVASAP